MNRDRKKLDRQEGFSLIEATVALGIVSFLAMALAATMMSALRAALTSKQVQQATALGTKAVEQARAADFDALAMLEADLAGDPNILATCAGREGPGFFDSDADGPLPCEPVVAAAAGVLINPHVTEGQISPNQKYKVSRYVTWASGAPEGSPARSYKRFTSVVEWTLRGDKKNFSVSALVSRSGSGVRTSFDVSPSEQTRAVAPSNQVVFAHVVRNHGLPDTFDLTTTITPAQPWTISLYRDNNRDGKFDQASDFALTDSNANSIPDTGRLNTDTSLAILAVWSLPPGGNGSGAVIRIRATSSLRPNTNREAADTLGVGLEALTLYLHNRPSPPSGPTPATANLPLDRIPPITATLGIYSNDHHLGQGRFLLGSNADPTQGDAHLMANWVYQAPNDMTLDGNVVIDLYAALGDVLCNLSTANLTVYVQEKDAPSAPSAELLGTGTVTIAGSGSPVCGFQNVQVAIPVRATIDDNNWIEIKIASSGPVSLAYDALGFASSVTLPVVSK